MAIEMLDPTETEAALNSAHHGRSSALISQIADSLTQIVDTESSVWVTGLTESSINSLRTRMYRKDINITVRKVTREGEKGHVITAKSVE